MADYIDKDKLENYAMGCIGGSVTIRQIHEFSAEDVAPVQKWIPVTERLPMPHTKVIVAYKQGVTLGYIGGYPKEGERVYFHGVHGWKHTLSSVTHWQYLPEPPKDGE